jgi:hypothetical protein
LRFANACDGFGYGGGFFGAFFGAFIVVFADLFNGFCDFPDFPGKVGYFGITAFYFKTLAVIICKKLL